MRFHQAYSSIATTTSTTIGLNNLNYYSNPQLPGKTISIFGDCFVGLEIRDWGNGVIPDPDYVILNHNHPVGLVTRAPDNDRLSLRPQKRFFEFGSADRECFLFPLLWAAIGNHAGDGGDKGDGGGRRWLPMEIRLFFWRGRPLRPHRLPLSPPSPAFKAPAIFGQCSMGWL
jgi:hypothetical protein